ncbi:hypothetical protein [uncultured Winogradskyella sp.]|uniref:hypothetical protein n=1 Tax=uncultured Winogradskyella sp. TaxID=395353 RepID=UPI00260AA536|nr:hypothetical protein [uncultured Winogradskyella sp.]
MVVLIFISFTLGGYLIGKVIASCIPDAEQQSNTTFINHHYTSETHNHLHIDKQTLKSIVDNSQHYHQNQSQD